MRTTRSQIVMALLLGLSLAPAAPAGALDAIPLYERVPIGDILRGLYATAGVSAAYALNEDGDAVGFALIDNRYRAFIYTEAHGVQLLPPLPGSVNHIAVDVTDRDVAGRVMVAGTALEPATADHTRDPGRGVLWVYDTTTGQTIETVDVGVLPGHDLSRLEAVNSDGWAVGISRIDTFLGEIRPVVYDYATGRLHAVDLPFLPVDINDAGLTVGGSFRARLVKDPAGGFMMDSLDWLDAPPGTGPGSIQAVSALGWVAGVTSMNRGDGAGRIVVGATRYIDGLGWKVVWDNSAFDRGSGINAFGDVVGETGERSALRAALHIESLDRMFLIEDLEDPPGFLDYAHDINDAGWIAGGVAGAVLLVRVGDMPPPTPPANLTAVPHEPTLQQPWNAITLSWENTSTRTKSYGVERSLAGTGNWSEIRTGWRNTTMWDSDVGLGVTYDYRVRAEGIAGFSGYSNVATATSPSEPVDAVDPAIVITAPQDGDTVSGDVPVTVEASDDIGLDYVNIQYQSQQGGSPVNICTEFLNGALSATVTCTWRTRNVAPGPYTISATAADGIRNWARDAITVTLDEQQKGGGGGKGGKKK